MSELERDRYGLLLEKSFRNEYILIVNPDDTPDAELKSKQIITEKNKLYQQRCQWRPALEQIESFLKEGRKQHVNA